MGIGPGYRSRSSYDKPYNPFPYVKKNGDIIEIDLSKVYSNEPPKLPNPDPKNYIITHEYICGKFIVLKIRYPDCTNFEGNKILVYKDITLEDLKKQGSIDPHFSDNKEFHSPIARFEPTQEGIKMALDFVFFQSQKGTI